MAGMSAKLHVPPGCTYDTVAQAAVQAWIKSRGAMMNMNNMQVGGLKTSSYKEDWRMVSIEYKGGAVEPSAQANEGSHNMTLGIVQTVAMGPAGCCTIL